MSDYVVTCCSTADLPLAFFNENQIPFIPFHYILDGKMYVDDLYETIAPHDFFKMITDGAEPTTSQVSPVEYEEFWKPFLEDGKDVLHISLSSGISGTLQSAIIAQDTIMDKYPDRKVEVIDSLAASSGYGLLVKEAADHCHSGMSLEDNKQWILDNRNKLHHWFFSTDLTSFIRGGRVSKASGFFGTVLNICPLLKVNSEGKLIPQVKCRGKQKAIKETFDKMCQHVQDGDQYAGKVYMSHSDCLEDAEKLAELIRNHFKNIDGEIMINNIGTVIGSHTGYGTVALFFWGDERTL